MQDDTDGGPAFPCQEISQGFANSQLHAGMSLRDWFAGQALAGLSQDKDIGGYDVRARWCYSMADAMLKARGS